MSVTPVFIIGMGRSGTHLLAGALAGHPQVRATIEKQPIFGLATEIALFEGRRPELLPQLFAAYRKEISETTVPIYLDKSQKALWCALELKRQFPDARFISIERNPYPCVASWLKGIPFWHKDGDWKRVSRAFLGIDDVAAAHYESFPMAKRIAMRWMANNRRIMALEEGLGRDLFQIWYEDIVEHTWSSLHKLECFLGLERSIPRPEIDRRPLTRWMKELSLEQVDQISDGLELEGVVEVMRPKQKEA